MSSTLYVGIAKDITEIYSELADLIKARDVMDKMGVEIPEVITKKIYELEDLAEDPFSIYGSQFVNVELPKPIGTDDYYTRVIDISNLPVGTRFLTLRYL